MNPSSPTWRSFPERLKVARLPRLTVTRQAKVPGPDGRSIEAFDIDTVDKLIEAFETKEREIKA